LNTKVSQGSAATRLRCDDIRYLLWSVRYKITAESNGERIL